jgi:hypothetical protein
MRAEKGDGHNDQLHLLEITVQLVRLRIALTIKGQVASTAWPFFSATAVYDAPGGIPPLSFPRRIHKMRPWN